MFVRTAKVVETGGVTIEVEDEVDWEEIETKLRNRDFVEFLPGERKYEEEDWEFDDLQPYEEDDDGGEAA